MTSHASVEKSGIDWEHVRERLRVSGHAIEDALAENPDRIRAAYRRRAAHLANRQGELEPEISPVPALVFTLHEERYAVALLELLEVLPLRNCTPVPGAAAEFLGIINLRGELRPVVDLGRMILSAENAATGSGFVLMLRGPGREIGLRVDRVEDLVEIKGQHANAAAYGKYTKKVVGEARLLLDIERVLAEIFCTKESLIA